MVVSFDGVNLLITLDDTDLIVDVETDLYSEWKNWQLLSDNLKFPPAFRTVGGDALTPGIEAGAYFFLNNEDGWRIKPAESSQTYQIVGNLAPENSALPLTVPTDGGFTVLLNGLQPITQSVEEILLAQQDALYNGEVWIDTATSNTGTVFPTGTSSQPVNNIADAFTIADRLSVRKFVVINSTITLDRAATNWIFEGRGANPQINIAGFDVSGAEFFKISPSGDMVNSAGAVRFIDSRLVNVQNFLGQADNCGLSATVSLKAGTSAFIHCFSQVVGASTPVVDCQSNTVDLSFRGYDGGLEIQNYDQSGNDCSIDVTAGRIVLGPTISDGFIVCRGVGELDDTSTGAVTINTEGLIDAQEAEIIHQMVAGNIDISVDNQTITVFEQGSTVDVLATFSVSVDGRIRRRLT